jgi:hypothetical protein
MDEPEWLCDLCGVSYDTETEVLECAWLDQAYGPAVDSPARSGLAAAA